MGLLLQAYVGIWALCFNYPHQLVLCSYRATTRHPPWATAAAAVGPGGGGGGASQKSYPLEIIKINREIQNQRKPEKTSFDWCFTLMCHVFTTK